MDLSNGSGLSGAAWSISNSGIILGMLDGRGWWQSPSPIYTKIDARYVKGGNRVGDAAGSQDGVLLATNGTAPWTVVPLLMPPGILGIAAYDINDSRTVVGNTLGSSVYALRWDTPYSAPVALPQPVTAYPILQVHANGISNSGLIVGYVYEDTGHNRTRNEAVLWSSGSVTVLPSAPGALSQAADNVNDAGVVVGYTRTQSGTFPVRWTPDDLGGYVVTVLNLPAGSVPAGAGAIDNCGRMVGGSDHGAFVWDGTSAPIILPNLDGSSAPGNGFDINDAGLVVGSSAAATVKRQVIQRPTLWLGLPPCTP